MKKLTLLSLTLLLFVTFGCGAPKKDEVSEGAKKVIEAMTTCPNRDLFDPEAGAMIGLGVQQSEAEKQKAEDAAEKVNANWEEAVGEYFADGSLDIFLNGQASYYLMRSELEGITVKTEKIELKEKTDAYETVLVTINVDGEKQKIEMTFSHNPDGLLSQVTFDPDALITGDAA